MLQALFGDYPLQFVGLPLIAGFVCIWSWSMAVAMIVQAQHLVGRRRAAWTAISALVAGNGVWATHYIVIIAMFSGARAWYEVGEVFDSAALIFACASIASYFLVYKDSLAARFVAGLALGVGVAYMPFIGLQGLSTQELTSWNFNIVVASVASTIALSIGAVAAIQTGKRPAARVASLAMLITAVAGAHFFAFSGGVLDLAYMPENHTGFEPFDFIARLIGFFGALVIAGIGAGVLFDRYQRERERYADTLEKMLAQLKISEQEAKAANKAKSDFLANMNHEIRTPMNGVLGMLEILKYSKLDADQRQQVSVALQSAEHLYQILQDVISLTLIDNAGVFIDDRPFDLRAVLSDVEKKIAVKCAAKNLLLSMRTAPDLPPMIRGDADCVRQVVSHLAENAVKFTAAGSIEILASVAESVGDRSQVNITVSDTGIGIDHAFLAQLFEPFSQGDSTRSRNASGLGVGLSLCRKLADKIGGGLSVESEPGVGSVFNFWFPAGAAPQVEPGCLLARMRALRILAVDDNHSNLYLLSALLGGEGHICDFATDGFEAIRRFTQETYDIILMDVQMPEMDGLTATAKIRAMEKTGRRVPILAVSAGDETIDRDRCLAAGMDGYVSKPIRPASLNRAISAAIAMSLRPAADAPEDIRVAPDSIPETASEALQTPTSPPAALDQKTLEALIDIFGSDSFQTALERTLDEAVDVVAKIRFALSARDFAAARQLALALTGMASNWGAPLLAERAREFESVANANTDLRGAVEDLDRQIEAARRALEAHVALLDEKNQRACA